MARMMWSLLLLLSRAINGAENRSLTYIVRASIGNHLGNMIYQLGQYISADDIDIDDDQQHHHHVIIVKLTSSQCMLMVR